MGTSASDNKRFSCSCEGRHSSAVWSESNEDRSLDLDTCSSSIDSIGFGNCEDFNGVFASSEKGFCESPFRFVLHRSPSSGRRTPEFSSPPAPSCRRNEEVFNVSSFYYIPPFVFIYFSIGTIRVNSCEYVTRFHKKVELSAGRVRGGG